MLVVNERAAATRSEQCVLDWMRTWTGQYVIVGLAISGCYLPDRNRSGEVREAELVVITPRAVVVIEAEGTPPGVATGVLSVQTDGRWRLSGFEGDPVPVGDKDRGPFEQMTSNVLNLEELVRKRHPDAFVDGLAVVVPPRDGTITLNVEASAHGYGVVLGSSAGLRAWFHRTANRRLIWTAEQTHALLVELCLSDIVTVEDLADEGFPTQSGRRKRIESRGVAGAARVPSPLGAISDTPPVSSSSSAIVPFGSSASNNAAATAAGVAAAQTATAAGVAAAQTDSDGFSEPRPAEPARPQPSDVIEVPVGGHLTFAADDSRAQVGAISLSKYAGPQSDSSVIMDQGTTPGGSQPLSAPATAPYLSWLMPDIGKVTSRDERARRPVRADRAPRSRISPLRADPQPIAATDVDQVQSVAELSSLGDSQRMAVAGADQAELARSVPVSSPVVDQVQSVPGLLSPLADPERIAVAGADQVQQDRSAPLPLLPSTDPRSWWVDPDRPSADGRAFLRNLLPTPTPPPAEPERLRPLRPEIPPAAAPSNQVPILRWVSAARPRGSTLREKGWELMLQLPQLLATALVGATVIVSIWILVSTGMNPHRTAVQPGPVSSTETVAPPEPPAPAKPPEPRCFPFQPSC